jgi:hypothetical protein
MHDGKNRKTVSRNETMGSERAKKIHTDHIKLGLARQWIRLCEDAVRQQTNKRKQNHFLAGTETIHLLCFQAKLDIFVDQ